ncbi:DUF2972 domain-containing protein [Campylobacter coli]|nr:DUF2972 domain-containing protein [Campylobacter coli]
MKFENAEHRIKNSLAYKLGFAIIDHKKQHGKMRYISLIYKLYKIKQQHLKEQKLYKQAIKIFPQLAYPKVESCKDYNESIKYKYHLSYILGEALIQAHKTWYKGGYIKLFFLLKEKYGLYRNIQEVINILPRNLHHYLYNLSLKYHKVKIQDLTNILRQYKDYESILENIFRNFDFFIRHFDTVESWLLSDKFKEEYKQKNYPYPPLLNPVKINYSDIDSKLAWDLNLPLPKTYKFLVVGSHGVGIVALGQFLNRCNLFWQPHTFRFSGIERYCHSYNLLLNEKLKHKALVLIESEFQDDSKFFSLLDYDKSIPVLCVVRDPILLIAHAINWPSYNKVSCINMQQKYSDIVKPLYFFSAKRDIVDTPSVELINTKFYNLKTNVIVQNVICSKLMNFAANNLFIDTSEFSGSNTFETIKKICKTFNLDIPKEDDFFYGQAIGLLYYYLPITIKEQIINDEIEIFIGIKQLHSNFNKVDRSQEFFSEDIRKKFQNVIIYISDKDYKNISKNKTLFFNIQKYINGLMGHIANILVLENAKKIKPEEILRYLYENQNMRLKLKNLFLVGMVDFCKQHRPDIVASWKYYQEFEKMCEELDKKE